MRRRAGPAAISEPNVRIGSTFAIPVVLRKFGIDVADVLKAVGLDMNLFHDPDNRISHTSRGRLINECVARTGCRHFGLLVGQQADLYHYGLVGALVMNSPDVATALRGFSRYLHLLSPGTLISLAVDGDSAVMSYGTHHQHSVSFDQISDGAIASLCSVLRNLCGPDWKPTKVTLAHRAPVDAGPYRALFKASVLFDAPMNSVVFAARWLTGSLSQAQPRLRALIQEQVDAIAAKHGDDFVELARIQMRAALVTSRGSEDQIAALLSLSTRTFRRRLNEQGTSFRELTNEWRNEKARQFLEYSSLPLAVIAECLGYAEVRPFNRAFLRWCGVTPAQWREARNRGAQSEDATRARIAVAKQTRSAQKRALKTWPSSRTPPNG